MPITDEAMFGESDRSIARSNLNISLSLLRRVPRKALKGVVYKDKYKSRACGRSNLDYSYYDRQDLSSKI